MSHATNKASSASPASARVGSGGLVRQWRVHGICFVPMEAEAIVEAATEREAIAKARALWKARKQDLIVGNSSDEGAAFEWSPTAEALPNVADQPRRNSTQEH